MPRLSNLLGPGLTDGLRGVTRIHLSDPRVNQDLGDSRMDTGRVHIRAFAAHGCDTRLAHSSWTKISG
jgi:hypothetical protein